MSIAFFNHYHNGDIHYSRGFIQDFSERYLKKNPNQKYITYYYDGNERLFLDLPYIRHSPLAHLRNTLNENLATIDTPEQVLINTWIGQRDKRFLGKKNDQIHLHSNKKMWELHFDQFDLGPLKDDFAYIPNVDWTLYQKPNEQLLKNHQKVVLVCNGPTQSGQGIPLLKPWEKIFHPPHPFDDSKRNSFISPVLLEKIAKKMPSIAFVFTQGLIEANKKNMFTIADLYGHIEGGDLMECGHFAAKYANTIIGRASGPFTTACTQESYFAKEKNFICLSNLPKETSFWTLLGASNKILFNHPITTRQLHKTLEEIYGQSNATN